jgi:hypothetical protein
MSNVGFESIVFIAVANTAKRQKKWITRVPSTLGGRRLVTSHPHDEHSLAWLTCSLVTLVGGRCMPRDRRSRDCGKL